MIRVLNPYGHVTHQHNSGIATHSEHNIQWRQETGDQKGPYNQSGILGFKAAWIKYAFYAVCLFPSLYKRLYMKESYSQSQMCSIIILNLFLKTKK
jgi:hypothetical protein